MSNPEDTSSLPTLLGNRGRMLMPEKDSEEYP